MEWGGDGGGLIVRRSGFLPTDPVKQRLQLLLLRAARIGVGGVVFFTAAGCLPM